MMKRIGIYLNEMFPVTSVLGSILTAVSVQLIYLRLYNLRPESYRPLVISGVVTTCVSLLIRIMDEFKDYEDDLTNFPMRPLPSGRVQKKDLLILAACCVFAVLVLSMSSIVLFGWGIITLAFTFLMLKWFFIEDRMRKSLPLAFVTHHPIVIFNFVYLILSCSKISPQISFDQAFYVLPICFIFTNWEVARKIRAPEQETEYTTYSKIFGPRSAVGISILLQILFTVGVFVIFDRLNTDFIVRAVFGMAEFLLMLPYLKFLLTLQLNKPLKPVAEKQILLVVLTLLVTALR